MRIGLVWLQSLVCHAHRVSSSTAFACAVITLSLNRPSAAQTPGPGGGAPPPQPPGGSNPPAAAQPAPSGAAGGRTLTIIVPEEGEHFVKFIASPETRQQ